MQLKFALQFIWCEISWLRNLLLYINKLIDLYLKSVSLCILLQTSKYMKWQYKLREMSKQIKRQFLSHDERELFWEKERGGKETEMCLFQFDHKKYVWNIYSECGPHHKSKCEMWNETKNYVQLTQHKLNWKKKHRYWFNARICQASTGLLFSNLLTGYSKI